MNKPIFNVKLGLTFAKLSQMAYSDDGIEASLAEVGYRLEKWVGKVKELNAFICRNDDHAVLVFQGTDSDEPSTIKADLKFKHEHVDGIAYDEGCYDEHTRLAPLFTDTLGKLKAAGVKLYMTGHSLGGGIAGVTMLRMPDTFEACYTFGGMRFCNKDGAKHPACARIYRIVLENDIVPLLPLWAMGYTAAGELTTITTDGRIYSAKQAYFRRLFYIAMPFLNRAVTDGFGYIKSHLISNYINALKNVVAQISL